MNCEQANQLDMVDYLHGIGYDPKKIKGHDYWFYSPFRKETEPSFKVDRSKNVWYDHGIGRGGKLVNFTAEYYRCNVSEALEKISSFHGQNNLLNLAVRPPFHSHENNLFNEGDRRETAIKIIAAKQPIQDHFLCSYLEQRGIEKCIADKHCHEVIFMNGEKEKLYKAIGFKNNAGGYELRNEYFKGSSSPKWVTYINNKINQVSVFEGFFDFLTYQTIHQNKQPALTNFLVLNSLSYFERSLLLMEKHKGIHLYLDQDEAGRRCTKLAQKRSPDFKDESKLYQGYKDLNDWMMQFGKAENQKQSAHLRHRHF